MGKRTDRNKMFWDSARLNNMTYQQYYDRLVELSCVMFEWKNLPETVDQRFLELTLFNQGKCLFFKDDALGFLALPVSDSGKLNVYGIPTSRHVVASNGYTADRNVENSVIIWNNYLHGNSKLDVEMFSRRLYNMDRTIDVNVNAQKTPVLIRCSEQQRLVLKSLYQEYDGNMPVIFGDRELDLKGISVLTTGAPYVADKIREEKTATWNEALTYLGISNVNVVKKERLVSDEVSRNLGGTIASRYSRLEMRRVACDQINAMFGLNIECHYREDYRELDSGDMIPDQTTEEGEERRDREQVHD